MTPADLTFAPLLRGRRARAPFVRAPRQAREPELRARLAPTWAAWWRLSKGPASSRTPPRRFLGIWLEAARHLLTMLGGPPGLGSLSERRSASATPTYTANTASVPAFNSTSGRSSGGLRAFARSRLVSPPNLAEAARSRSQSPTETRTPSGDLTPVATFGSEPEASRATAAWVLPRISISLPWTRIWSTKKRR